ncbi:MAG: DUF21 domain-containing protein [Planctomycetota bacterium]
MTTALILLLIGLSLSAFFSGSETGLYRVSRTRLVLDGLSGSAVGRGLVWLINHPAIFVATTLVGNNLANYLTSAAIVLLVARGTGGGAGVELAATVAMTPIVFVFGELLPKHLFYQAPYRLMRSTQWYLLAATVVFAPVSLVLGLLSSLLQALTGQTPFRLRLVMARGDLDKLLHAGHEAGILAAGQRDLAQSLLDVGSQAAIRFGVTPSRLALVEKPLSGAIDLPAARHAARRVNHPIVLVQQGGLVVGFYRYADLVHAADPPPMLSIVQCSVNDRHLSVLLKLYDAHSDVAVLMDVGGRLKAVVTRRQLLQPLLN